MSDGVLQRSGWEPIEAWTQPPSQPDAPARIAAKPPPPLPPIDVVVRGDVPHGAVPFVHNKLVRTMAMIEEPVLHARLKLTMLPDPAVERPAVAEAVLDVDGDVVRAHVAGRSTPEAADLLERRLRDRLEYRRQRRHRPLRGEPLATASWGPGMFATHRPSCVDRPVEERELVRHKAFTLRRSAPDEAVFDMEALDYDFHLFVDLTSGEDSVVWRTDDGYVLARLHASDLPAGPVGVPIAVAPADAPVLGPEAAVERLNAGRERFVFFEDPGTGRGSVVYRRVDGHYGLLTAAPPVVDHSNR